MRLPSVLLFDQSGRYLGDRLYPDLAVIHLCTFGLHLYLPFGQRRFLPVIQLAVAIEYHHHLTIHHMYAGVAVAIQVERVPLPGWVFGITLLDTMPALLTFLAK